MENKEKSNLWDPDQRLDDGKVYYVMLPTPNWRVKCLIEHLFCHHNVKQLHHFPHPSIKWLIKQLFQLNSLILINYYLTFDPDNIINSKC